MIRDRTGDGASGAANDGATLSVAISGVVPDSCAGGAAESRARNRSASGKSSRSDHCRKNCFQTSHIKPPQYRESNARRIATFRGQDADDPKHYLV